MQIKKIFNFQDITM